MIEDYSKIQPEVQKEIQVQLEKFFAKKQQDQQYELTKIQNHSHIGSDAPRIPMSSITSFIPIGTAQSGSVFNVAESIGQGVNVNPEFETPGLLPIPLITGGGIAPTDAFAGGEAPNGTLVVFQNVDTLDTSLWVKVDSFWFGIALPDTAPAVP